MVDPIIIGTSAELIKFLLQNVFAVAEASGIPLEEVDAAYEASKAGRKKRRADLLPDA